MSVVVVAVVRVRRHTRLSRQRACGTRIDYPGWPAAQWRSRRRRNSARCAMVERAVPDQPVHPIASTAHNSNVSTHEGCGQAGALMAFLRPCNRAAGRGHVAGRALLIEAQHVTRRSLSASRLGPGTAAAMRIGTGADIAVSSGQSSNKLLDDFGLAPRLGESTHIHQVGARKASAEKRCAGRAPAGRSPWRPGPARPAEQGCRG